MFSSNEDRTHDYHVPLQLPFFDIHGTRARTHANLKIFGVLIGVSTHERTRAITDDWPGLGDR